MVAKWLDEMLAQCGDPHNKEKEPQPVQLTDEQLKQIVDGVINKMQSAATAEPEPEPESEPESEPEPV